MAGMKRFIAYIYGYENAKKQQYGIARIELRGEECRLEIHLRSVYAAQTHCRVYLFRKQGNQDGGKPDRRNGCPQWCWRFCHSNENNAYTDIITQFFRDGRDFFVQRRWTYFHEPLDGGGAAYRGYGALWEWRESQPEEPPVEEEVYTKEDMHAKKLCMKQKNYIRNRKQAGSRENVRAGQHEKAAENRTQITRSAQKYDSELAATELPARNSFHSTSGRTSGSSF